MVAGFVIIMGGACEWCIFLAQAQECPAVLAPPSGK